MTALYNEMDKNAAQRIRDRIAAGLICPGHVDERDIRGSMFMRMHKRSLQMIFACNGRRSNYCEIEFSRWIPRSVYYVMGRSTSSMSAMHGDVRAAVIIAAPAMFGTCVPARPRRKRWSCRSPRRRR